jgi:hypothetical protein
MITRRAHVAPRFQGILPLKSDRSDNACDSSLSGDPGELTATVVKVQVASGDAGMALSAAYEDIKLTLAK